MIKRVWTDFYRVGRGAALLLAGVLALAACQTTAPETGYVKPTPTPTPRYTPLPPDERPESLPVPEQIRPTGLVPPHMEGRKLVRIGLLLPFSAQSAGLRKEAHSMLQAAQMALFETQDARLVLLPKDTGGTAQGAQSAASAAIRDGANILLGPILGNAVSAASGPAARANIPVIAFSTNYQVAGNGVYLLSFLPEADIKRMIGFIGKRNQQAFDKMMMLRTDVFEPLKDESIRALALLRPDNRYGDRIEDALFAQSREAGLILTDIARYGRDSQSMSAPARQIAHVDERKAAIKQWEEAGGIGDPGLDPAFAFSLPYQAIFIPESGVRLRSLAPLLPFYDVDPKITRFIGTSLWNDEDLLHEPALFGGWFPAPKANSKQQFNQQYFDNFAQNPSRLASLAHDAVRMVPQSLVEGKIDRQMLERTDGFTGADGRFRFGHDGLVQRLLSVFEIRQGKFMEIDPAPDGFPVSASMMDTPAF
jgi:outer membrane PBP1 activator LpoA protein